MPHRADRAHVDGHQIEVVATRNRGTQEVKVTEALFTFVALDENARPRALPAV
jgi:acyl-CoA thioesterase YciA